jgi:plastocyanin
MKFRGWVIVIVLASALVATGCSRANPALVAQAPGGEGDGAVSNQLEVAATAGTAYEQTELNAPAGQELTVTFTNPAQLPHNWVLVEPGQEQAVVDAADAEGNVPEDTPGALAIGEIIVAASEEIPVQPLEPGEYTYLCTFPGHYAGGMAGTLIVQ